MNLALSRTSSTTSSTSALVSSPLLAYLSPDGTLARCQVVFEKEMLQCKGKTSTLSVPFTASAGSGAGFANQRIGGTFMIKLFYLPAISGIDRNSMPSSVEECRTGLEAAERQEREEASGILTQLGGDCLVRSVHHTF